MNVNITQIIQSCVIGLFLGIAGFSIKAAEPRITRDHAVQLGKDDKPVFEEPPAGFDRKRDDIPHGRLEMIEYDSKTVGTKRKMNVDSHGHDPQAWRANLYHFVQLIFREKLK